MYGSIEEPVLTRWKTWLDAVNYYAEYYGKIMVNAEYKFYCNRSILFSVYIRGILRQSQVPVSYSLYRVRSKPYDSRGNSTKSTHYYASVVRYSNSIYR
ncbi:hypothetical protein ANN_03378 [Periplaneta americana]|uniref:Uncharacterized protein n=1 Tax=Periplaneta americana TaxID=6978 RepID=A0ABQ8TYZ1_PERAM|nr:hypothetical protein ANN_03378 [Periplaneta americana]